ncbi:MAG: hypothetical protein L0338_22710 [Acidobacteria bacterium]|nr:hypothetical protein [Acidobacteriota bacterium]
MTTASILPAVQTVAILDDDPYNYDLWKMWVEGAGYTPVILEEPFSTLNEAVKRITSIAQGAVCDHKLTQLGYKWPFDGAEVVARLYENNTPAILVTKYRRLEAELSIRRYRRSIPILLSFEDVSPASIRQGLNRCAAEIQGGILPGRRTHRAIVRVDEVANGYVVAFVSQWNPHQAVNISKDVFPDNIRNQLVGGQRYVAMVNIGAANSDELYFENIALAPDPDPDDGLA